MRPAHTILTVDDQAPIRQLLSEYLTGQGYRVVTAANGREALAVVEQEQPDLILLDVMMPEMDGFEFIRRYRPGHTTPIILVTARDTEADVQRGRELGASDYIMKPFRLRDLLGHIRDQLRSDHPQ